MEFRWYCRDTTLGETHATFVNEDGVEELLYANGDEIPQEQGNNTEGGCFGNGPGNMGHLFNL